jgi:hypothetical protein
MAAHVARRGQRNCARPRCRSEGTPLLARTQPASASASAVVTLASLQQSFHAAGGISLERLGPPGLGCAGQCAQQRYIDIDSERLHSTHSPSLQRAAREGQRRRRAGSALCAVNGSVQDQRGGRKRSGITLADGRRPASARGAVAGQTGWAPRGAAAPASRRLRAELAGALLPDGAGASNGRPWPCFACSPPTHTSETPQRLPCFPARSSALYLSTASPSPPSAATPPTLPFTCTCARDA